MDSLASLQDAFDRLGKSLDSDDSNRLLTLLEDASNATRLYTGQHFTRETTVQKSKPDCGRIHLSQRPVISITSLEDKDSNDVGYTWDGMNTIYTNTSDAINAWELVPYRNPHRDFLTVTYGSGYDTIPGVLIAITCQMALRAFGKSPETTGFQSEVIMGYNYTLGQAAAAGGIGMLPTEKETLKRFIHPAARTIRMGLK